MPESKSLRRDHLIQLHERDHIMYNLVWLVGAVVIIVAVLSFFGLR